MLLDAVEFSTLYFLVSFFASLGGAEVFAGAFLIGFAGTAVPETKLLDSFVDLS